MKSLKITIASLAIIVAASGCKKEFDQDVQNKNQPVTGLSPALLLPNIETAIFESAYNQVERQNQYTACNYTYYDNNKYWTGSTGLDYSNLNNVVAMETESNKLNATLSKPYLALAKFFRAYFFVRMTMKVGDVPMTDALKGLDGLTPKYDSQKQVFINALALLEDANKDLGEMNAVNKLTTGTYVVDSKYDFYFRGDLTKWQKVVNAYRLRVLINLSKKATDAELNVKAQFASIINNPTKYPLLSGMDDNLQYVYDGVFSIYPNSPRNFGNDATRYNMAATYLNTLASLNDLRAMKVAEPARGLGFGDTDFRSFVGGASGQDQSTMTNLVQAGKISLIGRHRYYETLTGENTFIVGYPEMCFNIAEAINQGWVTGDAEAWYKNGIYSDFGFYGVNDGANTVTFQKSGGLLGDDVSYPVTFSYATYYAQPAVKYAGNTADGLKQILTQKYLAFARNSGQEAYYQWRRTGIPAFDIGPGNTDGGVIPQRYQYPANERTANATNYNAAVQSQFGGKDDIYQALWIVK
ncbi:SusD/RagB family nutrient-binding outer membrane lipoprotein [Mucilaginibacter psychrotolerans]|uniref:SusD/RagB family nutrient-binding outer membrane lipoprotein n=1 Tax=Mucilaginibacter psychrotolerans TaxID=1524096 RepID=A0A4Y8SHN8_9SPHI|nr:SusD/RagB family nutrient-binding outer membrane lipoprotein [Mucilaginibacter psychrotolerans]TFF38573.1 SusD/RagB family nutrient-binding outer membrane lipoprotein [Mucilaginibacter psychrotolerans]